MKKKRIIILVVQILLVFVSVFFLINYTNKQVKLTPVYMYASEINDVNYVVKESDIKSVEIPASAITSSFALDKEQIIGKQVKTSVAIGQYIYADQLIEANQIDVFETMDLTKYRKISLPINMEESFSGNIKRGDLIDLLYTATGTKIREDGYGETPYTYTKTFMQGVLVYQVNSDEGKVHLDISQKKPLVDVVDESGQPTATESGDKSNIAIITLAVSLEQAEEIEARIRTGRIRFVGRFETSEDDTPTGFTIGEAGITPIHKGEIEEITDESGMVPEFENSPEINVNDMFDDLTEDDSNGIDDDTETNEDDLDGNE